MKRIRTALVGALVVAQACGAVWAGAPMAERVPGDSIVYVGFKGSENLGPGYQGSHLQRVVEAGSFGAFYRKVMPQVLEKGVAKDEKGTTQLAAALSAGEVYGRHGFGFYVSRAGTGGKKGLGVGCGIVCDAGTEAEGLEGWLKPLVEAKKPGGVAVERDGTVVRVSVAGANGQGLAGSRAFAEAMKQVQADPVFVVYVDFERGMGLIDEAVAKNVGGAEAWKRVKGVLGLAGLKRFVVTGDFAGADWGERTYIEAPAPRTGLVKMLDEGPVDPALVARVPADAVYAKTMCVDLAGLIKLVRSAVAAGDAQAAKAFDQVMGAGQMFVGRNIVTDVLEPLGTQWAVYQMRDAKAASDAEATVAVAKVADATRAQDGLVSLTYALGNAAQNPQFKARGMAFTAGQEEIEGMTVTTLAGARVSPSWAIRDGFLYVAASPERAVAAAKYAGPGFAKNREFAGVKQRLDVPAGAVTKGIGFQDLKATGPATYSTMRGLGDLGLTFMAGQGFDVPGNPLPPVSKVAPEFGPAGSVWWSDGRGMYSSAVGPFPGAGNASASGLTEVGIGALLVSILLPSLNRARETANRVKCAGDMRDLGTAMLEYSADHGGKFPPDLGALVVARHVPVDHFVCPSGDLSVPAEVQKMAPAGQAKWVNEHTDYVYVGAGRPNDMLPTEVLLYEKVEDHGPDGMNIMFGDGHIEFVLLPQARAMIRKQTGKEIGGGGGEPAGAATPGMGVEFKQFYSDDDGATTFVDSAMKIPPFDHGGKQTARAYVYTCDGGKTKFVAYLERYTEPAKKKMEAARGRSTEIADMEEISMSGIEVKKPGAGRWVKQSTTEGAKVLDFACRDGTKKDLELVVPDGK